MQVRLARVAQHRVFHAVEALGQLVDHREQVVHAAVENGMQRPVRTAGHGIRGVAAHLRDRRHLVTMGGDEEALAQEDVHLDQSDRAMLAAPWELPHEEGGLVVGIEFGALREVERVLDREGVKAERGAQDREGRIVGLEHVDPYRTARRACLRKILDRALGESGAIHPAHTDGRGQRNASPPLWVSPLCTRSPS